MSRRADHDHAGGAAGAATIVATAPSQPTGCWFLELLVGVFGGVGGSRVPDILEPATHPGHRAFFHGLAFNGAVTATAFRRAYQWRREVVALGELATAEDRLLSALAVASVGGYASHIALDATTPSGLPLIG